MRMLRSSPKYFRGLYHGFDYLASNKSFVLLMDAEIERLAGFDVFTCWGPILLHFVLQINSAFRVNGERLKKKFINAGMARTTSQYEVHLSNTTVTPATTITSFV